jgi:hypothetical protein
MNYEVVPTRALHIRPMAAKLRAAACFGLGRHGFDPRRALHKAVNNSRICKTALVDGQPEAIWGVQAPLLSEAGFVWLAMSDHVTQYRKAIVSEARRQLSEMMLDYSELVTTVLPEDRTSISFAIFLGFHDRHRDRNAVPRRKELEAELVQDPQYRIASGDSYVIALGWHGED